MASFLDARSAAGRWLLRIEDLDEPREVPGAADGILRCLENFGLHWDGAPLRQRGREPLYLEALARLQREDRTYRCRCSRRQLEGQRFYPGTCRHRPAADGTEAAIRFALLPRSMRFEDRIQGDIQQNPSATFGDFVLRRRDGIFAYMLAVVVDDAAQGITNVVRGADLLDSTLPQIQLQQALNLPRPRYAHVPLLVEPDGTKLAKSRRSIALTQEKPAELLCSALRHLGQEPPAELYREPLTAVWRWALGHWRIQAVPPRRELPIGFKDDGCA
ncbi:MAG: tRNA glutamyl-Q(34) synthetase GluQRS [Proteobacteria bacterium]|nr:tRNA glutamyl-Q(34) synthetase GluQRS [Pseudomonadota bacterium]